MATALEVVNPPNLAELAETINREHDLAIKAGESMVAHAILAGKALMEAREHVPWGEWIAWVGANTQFRNYKSASQYMRLARYEDIIGDAPSISQATATLADVGAPSTFARVWAPEAKALREQGMTYKQIGEVMDLSPARVGYVIRANAETLKLKQRHYQRRRRAEKEALKRQSRDKAAKRIGGGISDCYSRIRLTAEALDKLGRDGASEEVRRRANAALRALYRAEEEIVALLGVA